MNDLLVFYRALNLYAHNAHNLISGDTFFEDHAFFADIYTCADGDYDSIAERVIGTGGSFNIGEVLEMSTSIVKSLSDDYYGEILKLIEEINSSIESLSKNGKISIGTLNFIQGLADKNEVFMYKIKQRMA